MTADARPVGALEKATYVSPGVYKLEGATLGALSIRQALENQPNVSDADGRIFEARIQPANQQDGRFKLVELRFDAPRTITEVTVLGGSSGIHEPNWNVNDELEVVPQRESRGIVLLQCRSVDVGTLPPIESQAVIEPLSQPYEIFRQSGRSYLILDPFANGHTNRDTPGASHRSKVYLYYRNSSGNWVQKGYLDFLGVANRQVTNTFPGLYQSYCNSFEFDGSELNPNGNWEVALYGENEFADTSCNIRYLSLKFMELLA